jgi:hypothetical protein
VDTVTGSNDPVQPGVVKVVVDLELKRALAAIAERDDRSMSGTVRQACRAYVAEHATADRNGGRR